MSSTTPATGTYSLTEEQAFALTNPDGPVFAPGAFQLALGALKAEPRITNAFRTGAGVGWHQHDEDVFDGCERFFRPGYSANLVSSWLPALDGVEDKLHAGVRRRRRRMRARRVHGADGASLPEVEVHRIGLPRRLGRRGPEARRGLDSMADVSLSRSAGAQTFDGGPYDLVTTFDALHDMGDPLGAARHIREQLTETARG